MQQKKTLKFCGLIFRILTLISKFSGFVSITVWNTKIGIDKMQGHLSRVNGRM